MIRLTRTTQPWLILDPERPQYVQVLVFIRKNATGEVRQFQHEEILYPDDPTPTNFLWDEGNYGCDCNRFMFFQRAKGEDDSEDFPCGDTAYSVQLMNPITGGVYYDELNVGEV